MNGSFFQPAFPLLAVLFVLGCGPSEPPVEPEDSGPSETDAGAPVVRCGAGDDVDEDTISSEDEGSEDADGDGIPNDRDDDSDGDGFSDRDEAGDGDCSTPPFDLDGDGTPDFLDRDANGDGVDDAEQTEDTDGDGIIDRNDEDVDGDGIANDIEWGEGTEPADSDGDGTPDIFDLDSDADSISDRDEGAFDSDLDGVPNFLDLDSDDDGLSDAMEAGDGAIESPPAVCGVEVNAEGEPEADGFADFVDPDSDGDGFGDGEEVALGTDPCDIDSDDDGIGDLAEGAYERLNCPDGETGVDCGCATSPGCRIPSEYFYVVLPYQGAPVERDLDFATDIRVADIFFLTDITGSMGSTLGRVQDSVATPGTGLIDRISETIPDAWFGGGFFQDFAFGGYGSGSDEAFGLAIRMSEPGEAAAVASAFSALSVSGGADGPESHTEALYQTVTGEGGMWTYGGSSTYTMRRYVGDCLDTGWGAPCFRDAALAIIVLFTDICAHEAPPGDSASCGAYTSVSPDPVDWTTMIAAMNTRGAKFVGINASSGRCSSGATTSSTSPCYFLRRTAEETGSVDLETNALVYDLPNSGTDTTLFTDTVVGAIETVATRVPLDLDTRVRDDPSDSASVDASRFVKRRQPACNAVPPAETCWSPPEGVSYEEAVAFVDESTFFGVIPGTRVTFRITFQNDFYPGGPAAEVFVAFIDVRTGTAVLDTRQVYVLVPANPRGPIE